MSDNESSPPSATTADTGDFALAESTASIPNEQQATLPVLPAMGRWGALECRRQIAGGGFGEVYLAWDPALEREVALKVLPAAGRSHTVIQEGRLLARVRHPNVVTVYGIDEHEGTVGLWMEWVEGLTLTQVLTARGLLGGHEASIIGVDVCRAVAAVHKAGLLHRDIKAQNVMLEAGGRIVLMDFGAGEIRSEDSLAAPQMIGTPLYLAPELFAGHPATIASDIYSVGVLLYHLMTATVSRRRRDVRRHRRPACAPAHDRSVRAPTRSAAGPRTDRRRRSCARPRTPVSERRGAMEEDLLSVLEIQNALDETVAHETTTRRRRGIPSVAVLPFESLGPDQDLEYFCNGLAEELLTGLGKVPGLRVASRTSSSHLDSDRDRHQEHLPAARRGCRAGRHRPESRRARANFRATRQRRRWMPSLVRRLRPQHGRRVRRSG